LDKSTELGFDLVPVLVLRVPNHPMDRLDQRLESLRVPAPELLRLEVLDRLLGEPPTPTRPGYSGRVTTQESSASIIPREYLAVKPGGMLCAASFDSASSRLAAVSQ
jgi:hypothetical protein